MKEYYKIADLAVIINSYGKTIKQAQNYRCDPFENADIEVISSWENIKHRHPELDDDIGEYLSSGSNFYKKLLRFGGFMLHSSAVVVDGKAYLFTADSGTGKSTHTKLWLELFGENAFILNDDKPAIRLVDGRWYAYGTPWSGKDDLSINTRIPVAGVAVVERAERNKIDRITGIEAIQGVIRQCNRNKDMESRGLLMDLLNDFITDIPIWKLKCNISIDAAILAYEAMSGKNGEIHNE